MEFRTLTPEIVQNNLFNLNQVVFEVTSACNFRCEYCSYGKLYLHDSSQYKNESLSFTNAKILIDYLVSGWANHIPPTPNQEVYISFFGGEPLLNMEFITEVIDYIEKLGPLNRKFLFSMTTNGWLLNKYQDYLAEKDVQLLVSLDGDEYGDSYRVSASGEQTFSRILKNLTDLKDKHPDYFNRKVMFNSVIHNRNSLYSVNKFFKDTFGKIPQVSPLADVNINPDYLEEFKTMAQTVRDIDKLDDEAKKSLLEDQFFNLPAINDLIRDYFLNSGNVFRSYNELVFGAPPKRFQTGTCTPFSKKLYLLPNGDILACERIPGKFSLGKIVDGNVVLNPKEIAERYNSWLGLLTKLCQNCARNENCNQCIFQLDAFPDKRTCSGFISASDFEALRKRHFAILSKHPELYKKIFEEVTLT